MKSRTSFVFVVVLGFSLLLSGCFTFTGARTGKKAVSFAQWSHGPGLNDWQKLSEFLQKNRVVMNLHEYIAKRTLGRFSPSLGGILNSQHFVGHQKTMTVFPVRLEVELARRTTLIHYNEVTLGAGWMLLALEKGKPDWGSNLLYHHFSIIQTKWKNEGIHQKVIYQANSLEQKGVEFIHRFPESHRYSEPQRKEKFAIYEVCRWVMIDPAYPLVGIFAHLNIKNCFHHIFRAGLIPEFPGKEYSAGLVERFLEYPEDESIFLQLSKHVVPNILKAYSFSALAFASTLDSSYYVDKHAASTIDKYAHLEDSFHTTFTPGPLVNELYQTVLFGCPRSLSVILNHKIPVFHGIMHLAARQGAVSILETLNARTKLVNDKILGDHFTSDTLRFSFDCEACGNDYQNVHRPNGRPCCENPKRPEIQDAFCKDKSVFAYCDQDLISYRVRPQMRGIAFLRILLGSDEPYKYVDPVDFSNIEKNYEHIHVFYPYKTPLMFAAQYGRKDAVAFLLKHGADVNSGNGGLSALSYAAKYDYLDIARMLLAAGAHLTHDWVIEDEADVLKAFVGESDCDENPVLFSDSKNRIRTRWKYEQVHHPLFTAAREGHLAMVKLLLSHMKNEKYDVIVQKSLDAIAGYRVFEYPQIREALSTHLR